MQISSFAEKLNSKGRRKKQILSRGFLFFSAFVFSTHTVAADEGFFDSYAAPNIPQQKIFFEEAQSPHWFLAWQEARRLANNGEVSQAISKYEEILSGGSLFFQVRWECVSLLLSVNELDRARSLLESLIEDYPYQSDYLNALGFVLYKKGHFARSVELFSRSLELDPKSYSALAGVTQGYLALGQPENALPYLESLHAAKPENAKVFEELFVLYMDLALYEKARPFAVKLGRKNNVSTLNLERAALVHDALELTHKAEGFWRQILAREKDYPKAHWWLAKYYENLEQHQNALAHLLFLQKQDPENTELLARTGRCYLELQKPAQALPYFEKLLVYSPGDKEAVRHLVSIHASLGHEDETLSALDHYFQVEPDPSFSNLKKAARLYDSAGRYHDAIPIYRKLLKLNPDDSDVLATLAQDLLSIGEDEGALRIWAHLATVSPDSKAIYLSMSDLLLRLGRLDEAIPLQEELYRLDPKNTKNTLQLVSSYLQTRNFVKGEALFGEVKGEEIFSDELLEIRARIFENLEMFDHALADYEEILLRGAWDFNLLKKCTDLAGRLGKSEFVKSYSLVWEEKSVDWQDFLILANAFRDSGDFGSAYSRYLAILSHSGLHVGLRNKTLLEMARLYQLQGLFFEAEQSLRMALLDNNDRAEVLIRLVDLQLENGLPDDADPWLTQLRYVENGGNKASLNGTGFFHVDLRRRILDVKRFNASGKYTAAIRRAKDIIVEIGGDKNISVPHELLNMIYLELGKAYLGDEQFDEAEKQCSFLLSDKKFHLPALVLLERIYASQGDEKKYQEAIVRTFAVAEQDLGRMIALMGIYQEYGQWQLLEKMALHAREEHPGSFTVTGWLVRSLSESAQLIRARDILNEMEVSFPKNVWLRTMAADIAFRMGLYQEALSYSETVEAGQPERADLQLLHARVLWRTNQWNDSLQIYDEYLTVSVSDILHKRATFSGVKLPEKAKPDLWRRLVFTDSSEDQFVDHIMTPAFSSSVDQDVNRLIAPLYAKYRWQKMFMEEYAARKAVKQGDYFQAATRFSLLVEKYPDNESLKFDLAGIYSKLDRLGEEAFLYEELAMAGYSYPDLVEAQTRNSLKRKPRFNISYDYHREEGRDGYKAIARDSVDVGSRLSLGSGNDGEVLLSRIRYTSTETDDDRMANRIFAAYEASNIANVLGVRFGFGAESLSGGNGNTGLLECSVSGRLGDRVEGEFKYVRDVVFDTLASVERNIVFEDVSAGFYLGLFPRLLTGARFRHSSYSDGNEVGGYTLWANYLISPEPTALRFKFLYDFIDTNEKSGSSLPLAEDGFRADDSPYWRGKNYWKNSYGLEWKHKLSPDKLERGTPSYYSAEYLLDYDSEGHAFQTIRGALVIELAEDFMLNSSLELVNSDEYRSRDFVVSVVYRW